MTVGEKRRHASSTSPGSTDSSVDASTTAPPLDAPSACSLWAIASPRTLSRKGSRTSHAASDLGKRAPRTETPCASRETSREDAPASSASSREEAEPSAQPAAKERDTDTGSRSSDSSPGASSPTACAPTGKSAWTSSPNADEPHNSIARSKLRNIPSQPPRLVAVVEIPEAPIRTTSGASVMTAVRVGPGVTHNPKQFHGSAPRQRKLIFAKHRRSHYGAVDSLPPQPNEQDIG
jgi:hypothetical protein